MLLKTAWGKLYANETFAFICSCAKKMFTDDTKLNIFITFMHINLDAWLQLKTAWGKL